MSFFKRKPKAEIIPYDKEVLTPVIRASICTGEQTAGFKDKLTGKFREVMLIRNQTDLEEFKQSYGIGKEEDIPKIY